ncbi:MAG: HD domain-containing protein [Firmicutes bacterium]|nr:HD domain-containing protein [Bacillota bacterium]
MLNLPPVPLQLITLLESAGHAAYAVGGCVRDALLGQTPADWDLCTSARPEEVAAALRPHGITIHETGLQHGTVTAVIDHQPVEITTFRLDGGYTDHRRPDNVIFTDDLTADLSRRDFTVNAMAWGPCQGLADPFGGQADLQAGLLRCVGEPSRRFGEDALRILRCLRFASVLGFSIEESTSRALFDLKDSLAHVAAERIQIELTKLLCGQRARQTLLEYREVVFAVLPRLRPLSGFDQRTPWHCHDIWEHTCAAVEAAPPEPALRWAALLHDCGKPPCFFLRDGAGHFHGHAEVSETMAREILGALKCPKRMIERVAKLVRHHEMRLLEQSPAPAKLRRLLGAFGRETLLDLLELTRADVTAQAPEKLYRLENYQPLRTQIIALAAENPCVSREQLAVNGADLLPLGLRGPQLGQMLERLLEEVLEGRLPNERDALLQFLMLHA